MIGTKRTELIKTGEIREGAGLTNKTEEIREVMLRLLGQVARKTEENIVMRTWKMEVRTH